MADITPIASLNGELAMPEKVWMQGPPGPQGQQGEPGAAATVTVGTVTTGEPGTDAIVTNSGTESAAVLNFTIPRGATGATGPSGADGVSPTVSTSKSGNVTTITIVDAAGTKTATINDGAKGDTGPAGPAGAGVPDGGTVGQLLGKTESGTAWIDPPQSGVQPDWNQNDSTAADYVKNRPFYTGASVETVLVEESTVSFSAAEGIYMGQLESTFSPTVGETYKVSWDGTVYECTYVKFNNNPAIGNLSIADAGSDTGEPFLMTMFNVGRIDIATQNTSASHTLSISALATEVVKVDEKYLPDTVATKSEVEVAQTTANAAQTTANTAKSTAEAAKSTAEAAKSTVEAALGKTEEPYNGTAYAALMTRLGAVSGWFETLYWLEYYPTDGYFKRNYLSDTKMGYDDIAKKFLCKINKNTLGVNPSALMLLNTVSGSSSNYWGINGIAIGDNGELYSVSSNQVSRYTKTGLFLTFTPYKSIVLSSSTANSTKRFSITVDDNGTLTATEVT